MAHIRKALLTGFAFFIIACLAFCGIKVLVPIFEANISSELGEIEAATVKRVIDGDTIAVKYSDGSWAVVRLIGVDTPESMHPDASKNTKAGEEASRHTKTALPSGTTVWLEKDVSDTDKYGRHLRYVWTVDPTANDTDFATDCLNARLVAQGWAQVKDYPPDTKRSAQLHALEVSK